MKELKVGDILYKNLDRKIVGFVKIDRVTKTLAVSGNIKFNKRIANDGYITSKGAGTWSTLYYVLSNDKVKKEYRRNKMIYNINNYNSDNFTDAQLGEICKMILQNTKNETK